MGVQTSQLIVSLLDRLSAPARLATAAVEKLQAASARNAAALDKMRGQMLDAVGAGYALFNGLSAPVKAAVGFEEKMADIAKVVDFESPQAFKQMGKDIREMSLRIPIAAQGLADITAAAGQSGIANNELLKFTELSAKVATAWDVTAGEAGDGLAKLKTALGRTVEDTASLADAINYLSNKTASSAPELFTFTKSVAPMAGAFGFTAEQAAALGSGMIGAGFQADVAATSFLNLGYALSAGENATKGQRAAFGDLGLEAEDVSKSLQKNAVGTLDDILKRIRKLPKAAQASTMVSIFGKEARALGPLLTNEKLLGEVMDLVAEKQKYAGSAQAEYETRSKTTANAMQLFQNRVNDLAISVGDALVPALNKIMDTVGPVITNISDLAQRFPQATAAIVTATSAVIGFRVAITAMRFAGLYATGSLLKIATGFTSFAATVLSSVTTVRGAMAALRVAVISTGVGAILVGIAVAGAWIYENWNGIEAMFVGIGRGLKDAFPGAGAIIDTVSDAVSTLIGWIKQIIGPIDATELQWRKFGYGVGQTIGDIINKIAELPGKISAFASELVAAGSRMFDELLAKTSAMATQMYNAGVEMIQSLWDGAVAKFNELLAWFSELPSRIKAAIGRIDLSNIVSWPSLPSWAGGSPEPEPAVDGARASGGPVKAGNTYMVNERGQEFFTPGRSGVISPHEAYRAAYAGQAAGASVSRGSSVASTPVVNQVLNFHITGVSDARVVAQEAARLQGQAARAAIEASLTGNPSQ